VKLDRFDLSRVERWLHRHRKRGFQCRGGQVDRVVAVARDAEGPRIPARIRGRNRKLYADGDACRDAVILNENPTTLAAVALKGIFAPPGLLKSRPMPIPNISL
jgi:hypothetical protein